MGWTKCGQNRSGEGNAAKVSLSHVSQTFRLAITDESTLSNRTTQRLYTCVTLLYYLLLAPHSSLSLPTLFRNSEAFRSRESRSSSTSQLAYVQDWSYVALGTLAFTDGVPTWAEPEEEDSDLDSADRGKGGREAGEGEEAARLMDMKCACPIVDHHVPGSSLTFLRNSGPRRPRSRNPRRDAAGRAQRCGGMFRSSHRRRRRRG